jgi:hypothetical protein
LYDINNTDEHENDDRYTTTTTTTADNRYVQLSTNATSSIHSEPEILDHHNRDDIPPVMLSSPLAQILITKHTLRNVHSDDQNAKKSIRLQMDMELSKQWAILLKCQIILPAEQIRQNETDIRIMPYHIIPQVWTRLRPEFLNINNNSNINESSNTNSDSVVYEQNALHQDWLWCRNIQSNTDPIIYDDHHAIIQFLHTNTERIHISCGAKFGCDYLLYDGPRHERHAFAGLRIIPCRQQRQQHDTKNHSTVDDNLQFPIDINPYDIAAYVRCLNTAGKLALLATTIAVNNSTEMNNNNRKYNQSQELHRKLLIVDLVLEKIAITTSRRPKKTMEQRFQNLSKNQKKN